MFSLDIFQDRDFCQLLVREGTRSSWRTWRWVPPLPYGGRQCAGGRRYNHSPDISMWGEWDDLRSEHRRQRVHHVRAVMGKPRIGRVCDGHIHPIPPPPMPSDCLDCGRRVRGPRPGGGDARLPHRPGGGDARQSGVRGRHLRLPEYADGGRRHGTQYPIIHPLHWKSVKFSGNTSQL